jgi:predicted phage terminase large subunit-like protein
METANPESSSPRSARTRVASRVEATRAARRKIIRARFFDERVPRADRIAFLAKHVLGYKVLPFHVDMLRHEYGDHFETVSLAPRGVGKSTIGTIAAAVAEVIWNPDIRILIASKTAGQAHAFLREIANHFERNAELIAVFGAFYNSAQWNDTEITVAGRTTFDKEATITTVGVGGAVASKHYDLVIGDDLVDEVNSATPGQREKVRTWYFKVFLPTITDRASRIRIRNTLFHPSDLVHELRKTVPTYAVPAIVGGESIWPERFPMEFLQQLRKRMGSSIFNTQYMMSSEGMLGRIIRREWLRYYAEPPVALDERGEPRRHDDGRQFAPWEGFTHRFATDFAATKADFGDSRGAKSDWWTIVLLAREMSPDGESHDERIFLRWAWRGRVTKARYLARLVSAFREFQPSAVEVGCEKVAAQEHIIQDIQRAGLPVRRVLRTKDKISRCLGVQPYFENGQVQLPARELWDAHGGHDVWEALEMELVEFPDGAHDDLFDAVEMGIVRSTASVGLGALALG